MNRNRVVTVLALVGMVGIGLTVLMAANGPGDKPVAAKPQAAGGKTLVCLGHVDTEDRMVGIYPDNFPQASQVTKVPVKEGDDVTKGQPLLELDTEMYALNVQAAEIGIRNATADLERAKAAVRGHAVQVKSLEKELKAKQAAFNVRQKELTEAKRLAKLETKSPIEQDIAEAALQEAEFNLDAARIKWEGLKAEVPDYLEEQAQQGIEKAKNLKAQAERARDQVSCKAKADGRIIRCFVSEGSSFSPMTRDPAFWFVKKGPLIVRAEVTQEFAGRVSQGQSATIRDESDDKQAWSGQVTKVGGQFLPKRQSSGGALDLFPVSDDRVLECLVSIDVVAGQTPPRFGQKVRVELSK